MSRGKAAERRERILHTDSPSCDDSRSSAFSTLPTLPVSLGVRREHARAADQQGDRDRREKTARLIATALVACPHCSESYLTADTLHEIERTKLHRRSLAAKRCVPVVAFA
jgi:hypothetical protein